MKPRTLLTAAPAIAGALLLSGCYHSHTTEVPPPANPPAAAAPASCMFAGQAYGMGARMASPDGRTTECGRDGIWHPL